MLLYYILWGVEILNLVSTKEVAIKYEKTEEEVRYAVRAGLLRSIKIGRSLAFDSDCLPKYWMVRPKKKKGTNI